MNEQTRFFIKKYLSHFILERVDVGWVWQMSWRRGQTAILTQQYFFLILAGLLNCGSLRAQSPLSAAGSQFSILSLTDSNWLEPPRAPGYIIVSHPLTSTVLPLIYTGASLDWRLGWGSIYNIGLDSTDLWWCILLLVGSLCGGEVFQCYWSWCCE